MSASWTSEPLEDCIEKVPTPTKIKTQDFLPAGKYPVVSQEAALINGYWNNDSDVVKVNRPLIVFGDHTQVIKYVDFDFVVGADGVKLLQPKPALDPKFFCYQLQAMELETLGYARHFRLLKEQTVQYPTSLPEQQRIVGKLDAAFAALTEAQAHVERNRANARELFESYLNEVFEGKADGWVECKLGDICSAITKGTTPTTHGYTYQPEGINFIKVESVSEDHGLLPHMFAHVSQDCHTFLKRSQLQADDLLFSIAGALGRVAIVQKSHLPANTNQALAIVRLTHDAPVHHEYLMWLLTSGLVVNQTAGMAGGAAQQNLSLTQMKDLDIAYPSKAEQKQIVASLAQLKAESAQLEATYQQKLMELMSLKKAVLGAAFRGEL